MQYRLITMQRAVGLSATIVFLPETEKGDMDLRG